jgi:hypothetical protein
MASSRFAGGRQPTVTSRAWHLAVTEAPDGSLSVSGLPEDRETRLGVVYRLRDLLAATAHTDDIHGEGDARLWGRYARRQWVAVYAARTTVEYVPSER